jgi:hypothetical protein
VSRRAQIPELFYMPELIRDVNGVDFGNKADDTPLRDVQLPPWAEDSPERFIALHREALGTGQLLLPLL